MPFGLINAPSNFQRMTDHVLRDFPFMRVYLEDVVLLSKGIEEHFGHLEKALERVAYSNLKLKVS